MKAAKNTRSKGTRVREEEYGVIKTMLTVKGVNKAEVGRYAKRSKETIRMIDRSISFKDYQKLVTSSNILRGPKKMKQLPLVNTKPLPSTQHTDKRVGFLIGQQQVVFKKLSGINANLLNLDSSVFSLQAYLLDELRRESSKTRWETVFWTVSVLSLLFVLWVSFAK